MAQSIACSAIAIISYIAIYRALFVSKITPSTTERVITWFVAILSALCSTASIVLKQIPSEVQAGLWEMAFPLAAAGMIFDIRVIVCSRPQGVHKKK